MSIWIVIFAVALVAAVVLSRRAGHATPGAGCHGGGHAWPPDDITERRQARGRAPDHAQRTDPGEHPSRTQSLPAKDPPERELASGSASHDGRRHRC